MVSRLMTWLLVCVLMAWSNPSRAAVPCAEDDLPCLQLLLLQKQDEVLSLGRRLGLREQQVALLEESVRLVTEQRDLLAGSAKALADAADKLSPRWYESPAMWYTLGVLVGVASTALVVWGVSRLLAQ